MLTREVKQVHYIMFAMISKRYGVTKEVESVALSPFAIVCLSLLSCLPPTFSPAVILLEPRLSRTHRNTPDSISIYLSLCLLYRVSTEFRTTQKCVDWPER